MTYQRQTLRKPALFEGLGLHSGIPVKVTVNPGNSGIRFRYGSQIWAATPENVTDTTRCTRLGEISTVEHLMSALGGLEITDVEIEVSEPELPAMDGSSKPFLDGLVEAGFEAIGEADAPRPFSRIFVQDGEAKIAVSAGEGRWRYDYLTGDRWPGTQILEVPDVVAEYESVALARTFGLEEELPYIKAAGLAKGLDENSALILGKEGYLNQARCEDEPVRHKILDAIGDIYLAGIPIRFLNVVAIRTGHTATVKAAALLKEQISVLRVMMLHER